MGNDGGSIPKRRELVRESARLPTTSELKATVLESLGHAWTTCALSSEPLDPASGTTTVVSDWRGRLYNYESVLRCLIPSSSSDDPDHDRDADKRIPGTRETEFARTGIRSLRDVVKLKITLRKRHSSNDNNNNNINSSSSGKDSAMICPISMKELGPAIRAVYIVPCGHVFAEAAIREIAAISSSELPRGSGVVEQKTTCPECSDPFEPRDVVPILPADEAEVERCARRMEELRTLGLTHALKKEKSDKKKNKKKRKADETKTEENGGAVGGVEQVSREKKRDKDKDRNKTEGGGGGISSRINNSMTASVTAKVLAEQEERSKRRRMVEGYKRSEAVR